ncbi:MAG: dephospho-CoA kinase [Gemmataceae bacterium]|nr:dephospho-CoA kinase [Gemmataceae bacterium]
MPTHAPILGVVGGIGSGKSTVAAEIAKHGGCVIAGDALGHEVLRRPEVIAQIAARFGREVLAPDGSVDRRRLGAIVFADGQQLRSLQAIVFPYIGLRIREEIAAARQRPDTRLIVLDAAVMLEAGWSDVCDKVIFVDAPPATRLARVRHQRGWTEAEWQAREAQQLPLDEKRRQADAVIDNGPGADLPGQVRRLLERWQLG